MLKSGISIEVYRAKNACNLPKGSSCTLMSDRTLIFEEGPKKLMGFSLLSIFRATSTKPLRCEQGLTCFTHSRGNSCRTYNKVPAGNKTHHRVELGKVSSAVLKQSFNALWNSDVQLPNMVCGLV